MPLAKSLFREKTNVPKKRAIVFTTPGIYYPPYGKTAFLLEAQGSPGNFPFGGTVSTTNPATGGTYATTNAVTGGNYASTNPATGGTYASGGTYVPVVPASGGNVATAAAYVTGYAIIDDAGYYSFGGYAVTNHAYYTVAYPSPLPAAVWRWDIAYAPTLHQYSVQTILNAPYTNPTYYNTYYPAVAGYTNPTYYNPVVPGNANYNPYVPGNANYNPYVPGNANAAGTNPPSGGNFAGYNPATGGNIVTASTYVAATPNTPAYNNTATYSAFVEGTAITNAVVPGTTAYTPYVVGNAAGSTNILGVTLPGGATATAAPVVGYVSIAINYSAAGIPITVPPGGYVKIKNT